MVIDVMYEQRIKFCSVLRGWEANLSITWLMNFYVRIYFFAEYAYMHNSLVRFFAMVARNHVITRRRVLNERSTMQVVAYISHGKVRACSDINVP